MLIIGQFQCKSEIHLYADQQQISIQINVQFHDVTEPIYPTDSQYVCVCVCVRLCVCVCVCVSYWIDIKY